MNVFYLSIKTIRNNGRTKEDYNGEGNHPRSSRGKLEEQGKRADFVVINKDVRKVAPEKIRDLRVLQTYVGGKKVFDRDEK